MLHQNSHCYSPGKRKKTPLSFKSVSRRWAGLTSVFLFSSLNERDALVTSLQAELKEAREKPAADAVSHHWWPRRSDQLVVNPKRTFLLQQEASARLVEFQNRTKETLRSIFPQISVDTEQV